MALLQQWRDMAYDQQADKAKLQQFWAIYFTKEKDIYAEVVSMPSWNRFVALPSEEKENVLHLPYDARVSVEMGSTFGWGGIAKYNIGIDQFGASGKAEDLLEHFGFTPIQIAGKISSFFKE